MRISDWSSDVYSSDLLSRIACREVIEVAASDIGIIGVQLQYAGLKLELLRRADARGPLGSLRDRLARPIHFDQLATDQLILEPASFLVTRSEEHTSELQSLMRISYAVFCLKKKTQTHTKQHKTH